MGIKTLITFESALEIPDHIICDYWIFGECLNQMIVLLEDTSL